MTVKKKNLCAVLTGDETFALREEDIEVNGTPLIEVTHIGVCGTDLGWWKDGGNHIGQVIGHEFAGVIVDPGDSQFQIGDRVSGYTQNNENEPCGHCPSCLAGDFDHCDNRKVYTWKGGDLTHPGAYARYTTWFPKSIYRLPPTVSNEEGALLEPMTVCLHGVTRSGIRPNDRVLILGGGIIGLGVAEWARNFGAGTIAITEIVPDKIRAIQGFGCADYVLQGDAPDLAEQFQEVSHGGFDVVFDCAGVASAVNHALIHAFPEDVRARKVLVSLALAHREKMEISYNDVVLREVNWMGSKGHLPGEFEAVLRTIASGKLDVKKYITNRFLFSDIQKGFEAMKAAGGTCGKSIIEMD